ncbi:MAG: glycosyltransferase [Armatimonadetes bacterium]|nr:glycosyltransferase [Armatimonadota bacterium]
MSTERSAAEKLSTETSLPTVAVIVPTYRRPTALVACLNGLAAQTRPADEVIVVVREEDQDTRQAVAEWLAAHPGFAGRLRTAFISHPGQIPAMNAGLAAASSDIVCFTDDDCVPRPEWLERLASHYAGAEVGGAGGRDVIHRGDGVVDGQVRVVGRYSWYGRPVGNHHLSLVPAMPTECDILKGANMSFRRVLLGEGFDESLQLGAAQCNDMEACLSVRRQGFRLIYDPLAIVDHYPAERFGEATRAYSAPHMLFAEGHNWAYAAIKHARPWQIPAVLLYGFLVGHARAYGLVRALLALREQPPAEVARRLWHSWRGKTAAVMTLLKRRGPRR